MLAIVVEEMSFIAFQHWASWSVFEAIDNEAIKIERKSLVAF